MKFVIDPAEPFAQTGLRLLEQQYHKMVIHEAGTIEGRDVEELHEMRIGARRVRATMDIFGPAFPAQDAAKLSRRVARLARKLGNVRDLDVQLAVLESLRRELRLMQDDATESVRAALAERQAIRRKELLDYLAGKKCHRFKKRMDHLLRGSASDGSRLAHS